MDINTHWEEIRKFVNTDCRHCSVASTGPDGTPHVIPIGSMFLTEAGRGFYFEKFVNGTRKNLEQDNRLSILALSGSIFGFFMTMFRGRAKRLTSLQMQGTAGKRRPCTPDELGLMRKRIAIFQPFTGYEMLWGKLDHVREIRIESAEPLNLGALTYRPEV